MKLKDTVSEDKLRGGFYTPAPIAEFMLKWAISDKNAKILEPSCGDGVFLKELKKTNLKFTNITAIEYNKEEYLKTLDINLENSNIINHDFLKFFTETKEKYDVVIGNPPYIRYQFLNDEQKEDSENIFKQVDLKYSKLTNIWVTFVIASSLLLKEKGKIAFVLPAEILQVSYAKQLRNFLGHFYNKINIISFEKLVFPDIQQEVVLLLCEKDLSDTHMIDHTEIRDANDLVNLNLENLDNPKKRIDFKSNKWTFYFLEQEEIDFLENLIDNNILPKISDFAKVEVGITTGANPYFTVPLSTVEEYNLENYAKPLVGRSVQVPSAIFTQKDWNKNRNEEARTHLLTFDKITNMKDNDGVMKYIKFGEENGIHQGYKCRIREEWQIIPSLRISDALFIRRNSTYPRLIINEAQAYTTDTMHRVTVKDGINIKSLVASYYNSISLAFSEISGRSHGGGVLELMPNEAENILLPYNEENSTLLNTIDKMTREKKHILEILEVTDSIILKSKYNFTDNDIQIARNIWRKLSNRRKNRTKK